MSVDFCVEALEETLQNCGIPSIFNSNPGVQFTSEAFTGLLRQKGIAIGKDSKGRAFDTIFTERFWRTIKYEWLYLHSFDSIAELRKSLQKHTVFYNTERVHEALNYNTPDEIYLAKIA